MPLLPRALRPAVLIRRRAIYRGLLGPSMLWKIVAAWVFGKGTIKKFLGKQPESLGRWKVGSNEFVNVINAKPMKKKQRKRLGISKELVVDQAKADVASARPGRRIKVKK